MNRFFIATLISFSLLSLAACSSDGEPTGIDTSIFDGVSRSEKQLKYEIVNWAEYNNYNDGNGWVEFDLNSVVGWELPAPTSIIFQNGMTLFEEDLFTEAYGPDPILLPLEAYKKSTRKNFDIYISTPLNYKETTGELKIGGTTYVLKTLTNSKLIMEQHGYGWKMTVNGDIRYDALSVLEFRSVDFSPIDLDKCLIGSDLKDIQRKVIAMCREHFGNTIDLTAVYGGNIYLDDGNIIDLDELEALLGL